MHTSLRKKCANSLYLATLVLTKL